MRRLPILALALAACTATATIHTVPGTDSTTVSVHVDTTPGGTPKPDTAVAPDTTPKPDTGALFGFSLRSPHHTSATWAYTDFYFAYHKADTAGQRILATHYYDRIMSGSPSAWHALDSTIVHTRYGLWWFTFTDAHPADSTSRYRRLTSWLTAHGYPIEPAFLHEDTASAPDSVHRVKWFAWADSDYALNPADPGVRAYRMHELRDALAAGSDGMFYDTFARGAVSRVFHTYEGDSAWYTSNLFAAIRAQRDSFPHAHLVVNLGNYMSWFDSTLAVAAGGAQLELSNNPWGGPNEAARFRWTDHLVAAGVGYVEFVSSYQWTDKLPASISAGLEDSVRARQEMTEYAAYLIARDTGRVVADNQDNYWSQPPETHWYAAFDADLGQPSAPRSVLTTGTDPLGQKYQVWQRPYGRGLVLLRLATTYTTQNFGDSSAVAVPVPAGLWRLRSTGDTARVDSTIALRQGEGVILVRLPTP